MVCDFGISERVRALPSGRGRTVVPMVGRDSAPDRLEASRLVEEAEELTPPALTA